MTAQDIAVALEQENAYLREQMHAALSLVEQELHEACYHPDSMEYYDDPCVRCVLRSFLTPPDLLGAR